MHVNTRGCGVRGARPAITLTRSQPCTNSKAYQLTPTRRCMCLCRRCTYTGQRTRSRLSKKAERGLFGAMSTLSSLFPPSGQSNRGSQKHERTEPHTPLGQAPVLSSGNGPRGGGRLAGIGSGPADHQACPGQGLPRSRCGLTIPGPLIPENFLPTTTPQPSDGFSGAAPYLDPSLLLPHDPC